MKVERFLFLDIDGVLNTKGYSDYLIDQGQEDTDEDGALFDPDAVENLATIIKIVPDAKILISSTWRFKGWEWMKQIWEKRKMPGTIYGFTPELEFARFKDIVTEDYTESVFPNGTRGLEIGEWLRNNRPNFPILHTYAIIDDEDDFPSYYKNNLVLTNPLLGLTAENAIDAINLLDPLAPI